MPELKVLMIRLFFLPSSINSKPNTDTYYYSADPSSNQMSAGTDALWDSAQVKTVTEDGRMETKIKQNLTFPF